MSCERGGAVTQTTTRIGVHAAGQRNQPEISAGLRHSTRSGHGKTETEILATGDGQGHTRLMGDGGANA
jgi:hypothetical protein